MEAPSVSSSSPISKLTADNLRSVFSYLSLSQIALCSQVCKLWRTITEQRDFLSLAHPKLSYFTSGLAINAAQFIAKANRYQDKLGCLDLRYCSSVTDQHLEKVTAQFQSLEFSLNSKITEGGVISLMRRASVPIKLSLNFGTGVHISTFFNNLYNVPKLTGLNISQCSQSFSPTQQSEAENENRTTALRNFIARGGLQSPCKLDVSAERWVDRSILETIVTTGVKLSYLNATETALNDQDLLYLINNNGLTLECEIVFDEFFQLTDEIIDALLIKNIKLSYLYLDSDTYIRVSAAQIEKLIRGGLNQKCKLELCINLLTCEIVNAIIDSKTEITEITFNCCEDAFHHQFREAFRLLFDQGNFSKPFSFTLNQGEASNPDEMFTCLANERLKFKEFKLNNATVFSQNAFIAMCQKNVFVSYGLQLGLQNVRWNLTEIVKALATTSIKFGLFDVSNDKEIDTIAPSQGIFEITFAKPYALNPIVDQLLACPHVVLKNVNNLTDILTKLARSCVSTLSISFVEEEQQLAFLALLKDKKNFPNLILIQCSSSNDKTLCEKIRSIRPALLVFQSNEADDTDTDSGEES